MMMTHEDRQQCLQFFRGGRFVFLFSKQEKCRQKKRSGQVMSGQVGPGRVRSVRSGQVGSGRVRSGQVTRVRSGRVRYIIALWPTTNQNIFLKGIINLLYLSY